jgi:ATP-dependent RNA helicase RhlE
MFKAGKVTCLVATEVAARGLDIKELPQVVNYELPNVPEDYVHRIGRTGRAGSAGEAISLVSSDESGLLRDIERVLRRSIPTLPTPVFKIVESASPPPSREGRPQHVQHRHGAQAHHGGGRRDGSSERRDSRRPQASGVRSNSGTGSANGTRSFGQPQRGRFR